jgi:2-C-methyl-D-erythritol 2,4-cyclodiphosphate synthase
VSAAVPGDGRGTVTTGLGYDCHPFAPGRRLVLGGVEFEHDRGLAGHSDADVLTHAIIDALLGAAGLGDIGQHFPDSDERYRDADSLELLRTSVAMLVHRGFTIVHVDATVVIERPHLAPAREDIRLSLAQALGISSEHVNVKATRGEGMGFVGREEGAVALAIATVER